MVCLCGLNGKIENCPPMAAASGFSDLFRNSALHRYRIFIWGIQPQRFQNFLAYGIGGTFSRNHDIRRPLIDGQPFFIELFHGGVPVRQVEQRAGGIPGQPAAEDRERGIEQDNPAVLAKRLLIAFKCQVAAAGSDDSTAAFLQFFGAFIFHIPKGLFP